MFEPTEEQRAIVDTIRKFLDRECRPHVRRWDREDSYPDEALAGFTELGLFGATIPERYGGLGWDVTTYVLAIEEIAACWMSLSGMINTHLIMAHSVERFGTDEQKARWLPRMARAELRGGLALSEASGGSDVAAMRCRAERRGDHWVVNGSKMWITNSDGNAFLLVCKTAPDGDDPHRAISAFVVEKGHPGFRVSRNVPKLGYRGIPTSELVFEDFPVPGESLLGAVEGRGFAHVMGGLELGRINVAARAVGMLRAAFDDSLRYAKERVTFGKPIWQHQLVGAKLSEMGTDLEAARLLVLSAAAKKDRGERCDVEASMAKLFASRAAARHALEAIHVHGAYGFTSELDVERYYRDAPLMTIGEGTNEILTTVIAKGLVKRSSG